MAAIVSRTRDARIPAGAHILSVNRHRIEDFLDFNFHDDRQDDRIITIAADGCKKKLSFRPGEKIDIELAEPEYRHCVNSCRYCFVNGLPPGLRPELYFRDDDYRLSFLHGNFLSLTNVTDNDIRRIGRLRLSPLYISVHATEPALRRQIFGNKKAGPVMEQLRALIDRGVTLHTQIVTIPGLNERSLDKTVADLARLYPGVQSIGIVPVGISRYNRGLRPVTRRLARQVARRFLSAARRFRRRFQIGLVYLADEFFITAGWRPPDAGYYDGYPQYENGIGMTRHFLDEVERLKPEELKKIRGKYLLLTGIMAAPSLRWFGRRLENSSAKIKVDVRMLKNTLFGNSVTASGLIGSQDFEHAAAKFGRGYDRIFLPPNCVNGDGLFLDEMNSIPRDRSSRYPISFSYPHTIKTSYPHHLYVAPYRVAELVKCLQ